MLTVRSESQPTRLIWLFTNLRHGYAPRVL